MYRRATSTSNSLRRFLVVCAVLLLGAAKEGYSQRVYATSASKGPSGVTNENHAVSPDPTGIVEPTALPRSNINVSPPILSPTQTSFIQLQFHTVIPQNSLVIIRVSNESVKLGGSIGVSAHENNVVRTSTASKFMLSDGSDFYAIRVTGGNFNQVRVTVSAPALGSASINIFYAFYEPVNTNCVTALGTSKSVGGLLPVSADVNNITHAIDGDLFTNSQLFIAVGVAATVSQTIYFSNLSNPGDAATVTISVNPALLSLGLLGNTAINLYNGTQLVGGTSLSGLLQGTDLLGLLQTGNPITFSFVPEGAPVAFDRISISMSSLAGVLTSLNVHEVQRTPAKPALPITLPTIIETCDGESLVITIESPSDGSILRWYDENGILIGNIEATVSPNEYHYLYPEPGEYKISVAASWESECIAESERTELTIIVHQKPPTPDIEVM